MYPAKDARELAILLRISRELDIVGDVTATVDNPSELLAWALVLSKPEVLAWRAEDSGHCYLHVTANRQRAPIRGTVASVLDCEQHGEFWNALGLEHLRPGDRQHLTVAALSAAWAVMPITPTSTVQSHPAPTPGAAKKAESSPPAQGQH
ncbi:hypothetical protein [Nocardioides terrisoli]|uniref:hypothetical protein n=1 Tax=Nocardioides terrisoli TaxID=3388267 RepID=UPI00287BA256|nr:hypothetical protein [Nocardioides marmorisolisilvae]